MGRLQETDYMSSERIDGYSELVSENLRYYLKLSGMSRKELSRRVGVDYKTINKIVKSNGTRTSFWIIISICEVLGIRLDQLVEVRKETKDGQ